MTKAIWNGAVVAESDDTVVVEGNRYFPADSIHREFFVESDAHTVCPWKGTASYYTLVVGGERNEDAAWYYREPKSGAQAVRGRVAFWRGVRVVDDGAEPGGAEGGLVARLARRLAG